MALVRFLLLTLPAPQNTASRSLFQRPTLPSRCAIVRTVRSECDSEPVTRLPLQNPDTSNLLPWTRFWSPRKSRTDGTSSEFFEGPQGFYGEYLHQQAAPLSDITPEIGLLVLCGEPGLGKTTELDLLRERLAERPGGQVRIIHLKAREFESFVDLQSHLDAHPSWQRWLLFHR